MLNDIQPIVKAYVMMRSTGLDADFAFNELQTHISGLDNDRRALLIEQLRQWESDQGIVNTLPNLGDDAEEDTDQTIPVKPDRPIKPLKAIKPIKAIKPLATAAANTCPKCGRDNETDAVFCAQCGTFISKERGQFETNTFDDQPGGVADPGYFSDQSYLVMVVKGLKQGYKLRPQNYEHDLMVGRSSGGTIAPDIDLAQHRGDELGVSRMHLSIAYDPHHHTLTITDLDSSNGTFVNDQRLHPREVRVLRHGDELRLAKLMLVVYFQHPQNAAND
jgi:hypothetical protein